MKLFLQNVFFTNGVPALIDYFASLKATKHVTRLNRAVFVRWLEYYYNCYSITTCYNFTNGYSLLSYLEYPIILIQEYILIYLVLKYTNLINTQTLVATIIYFIICIGLVTKFIPKIILVFLIPLCTPISASSKLIQLTTILRTKQADSVSPITWLISVLTNLTRIFTIWMDSADILLLGNFITSTALSASIVFATLYYRMNLKKKE